MLLEHMDHVGYLTPLIRTVAETIRHVHNGVQANLSIRMVVMFLKAVRMISLLLNTRFKCHAQRWLGFWLRRWFDSGVLDCLKHLLLFC
jgi:hypothetical protein